MAGRRRIRGAYTATALSYDGIAELPRVLVDTTYTLPSTQAANPVDSAAFSAALTAIDGGAGDKYIVLNAGTTYTGPFTLPVMTGTSWLYIVSSARASLPGATTRVAPADASNMPLIVAGGSPLRGFQTLAAAHHVRIVGCEIKFPSGQLDNNYRTSMNNIGNGETLEANLPSYIFFDRCLIHGDSTAGGIRGIALNGTYCAVINSYLYDFKRNGDDTQAVWVSNTPGPIKIVNNYLEATGENFMTGGSDPTITNCIPSDIEFRGNHCKKLTAWNTYPAAQTYTVKNNFELKNSRRALVEKNVFENQWEAAQNMSMNLKSTNQDGGVGAWCTVQDVVVRHNKFINIENWIKTPAHDDSPLSVVTNHVQIRNNLGIITQPNGGSGRVFECIGLTEYVRLQHNTVVCTGAGGEISYISNEAGGQMIGLDIYDNIFYGKSVGLKAPGAAEGTASMILAASSYTEHHNAMVYRSGTYGTGTIKPANEAAVLFTNAGAADYTLQAGSPCKGTASDGGDMGADVASIETYATAAINGTAT